MKAAIFTWLNKQGVESSTGFKLQRMHRFYYHYFEGERRMQVTVEPLTDGGGIYREEIRSESFNNWLPPHDREPISAGKAVEIQTNVSAALTFMGIPHEFR